MWCAERRIFGDVFGQAACSWHCNLNCPRLLLNHDSAPSSCVNCLIFHFWVPYTYHTLSARPCYPTIPRTRLAAQDRRSRRTTGALRRHHISALEATAHTSLRRQTTRFPRVEHVPAQMDDPRHSEHYPRRQEHPTPTKHASAPARKHYSHRTMEPQAVWDGECESSRSLSE